MSSFSASGPANGDVKPLPHLEVTGASGPNANLNALQAASSLVEEKHLEDEQSEQEKSLSNLLSKQDNSPYYMLPFENNMDGNNT